MHIFLNAAAASAASGLTYIRNVLPHLADHPGIKTTVLTSRPVSNEFAGAPNLCFMTTAVGYSVLRRFWFEQHELPTILRCSGADVLISAGNFAVRCSPAPQILLSGNALYISQDFGRDLLRRGQPRAWLDWKARSWLAKRSMRWADCTVAPSEAFAHELEEWSGRKVRTIAHGFDEAVFLGDTSPLPAALRAKLVRNHDNLYLLHVSHYNYFRNFETLFRALPLLKKQLPGRTLKLVLTCELRPSADTAEYDPRSAAALIQELGIEEDVVQLGVVPYRIINQIYSSCDIYVSAAYAESFAHPTVEAMSCGLPIVASDLPVHREVCGDAAIYFQRFSVEDLARQVAQVATRRSLAEQLSARGRERSRRYSWTKHVTELLALARDLVENDPANRRGNPL